MKTSYYFRKSCKNFRHLGILDVCLYFYLSWMRKGTKAAVELDILSYGEAETYDPNEMNDAEKNNFVKQYIDKIVFEKTLIKRGHYKMTIYYKYSEPTTHYLWSSGPWNHID